ncbi:MAG: TRAP transporter small permease [Rubrivivax sp.]
MTSTASTTAHGPLDILSRGLAHMAMAAALAGAAGAAAIGAMTVASVLGRALWSAPIPGDVEITQVGIGLALSLCLPWCQARRANIFVDFFTQRLAPPGRQALDRIGTLLLAGMYALLSWRTSVAAFSVHEAGETTMVLSLPMWWAYAGLAPGLGLAALIALLQALRGDDTQPQVAR